MMKSRIALGGFTGPVWALDGDPEGLSHFSFFCVSTPFVMLSFSMFSSASLALLCMYSIQSSNFIFLACCALWIILE